MSRLPNRITRPRTISTIRSTMSSRSIAWFRPSRSAPTTIRIAERSPSTNPKSAKVRFSIMKPRSPPASSSFLQARQGPGAFRPVRKSVLAVPHPSGAEHLFQSGVAHEVPQVLVRVGTAECDRAAPARRREGVEEGTGDPREPGFDDPGPDLARISARIPNEVAAHATASDRDEERLRELLGETREQPVPPRPEERGVERDQGREGRGADGTDPADRPAALRSTPADDLVLRAESEALVERDRAEIRVQPDGLDASRSKVIQGGLHHPLPEALIPQTGPHDDGAEEGETVVGRRREGA